MKRFTTVAQAIAEVGEICPTEGFVFQDMRGAETTHRFTDLERITGERAAALQQRGLVKGDRMALIVMSPEEFVITLFAAIRIGVIPVPLYPPMSFGSLAAYTERTSAVIEASQSCIVVASPELENVLKELVDRVPTLREVAYLPSLDARGQAPVYPEITPDDVCFLQYTSGSTSAPKGVVVTHDNLVKNCQGTIVENAKMRSGPDCAVTWLPLYHDMGLIGFVIGPVLHGIKAVFIPTLRFITRPSVWMDTIHQHRGTATFAPNFAYALATRRVKSSDLEKWDLSCLKLAGCGAEPIQPDTMRAFTDLYAEACGLPRTAVLPAYGMAEATVGVSFKPVDEEMRTHFVDVDTFEADGKAIPPVQGKAFVEHVSCGPPFNGHRVVAKDTDGNLLPELQEGELCLWGPSNTRGYFRNPEATAAAYKGDWIHTGDLGYLYNGEIYVTGRIKDLIILNGRNIHPQSVEWVVAEIHKVRKGNVVAFSRPAGTGEQLIIALETRLRDTAALVEEVKDCVHRQLSLTPKEVVVLPAGALPKTSSGKLQRRKTRQMYLEGAWR